MNAATIFILARMISVEEYGAYGLFITTIMLACALGSCGLRQAIAYFVGRGQVPEGEVVAGGIALVAPLTLVSAVGAAIWLTVSNAGGTTAWEIPIVCAVLGLMLMQVAQGRNLGLGEISFFNLYETAPFALMLFGIALVWGLGKQRLDIVVEVVGFAYLFVGVVAIVRTLREKRGRLIFTQKASFGLMRQGLPYALAISLALGNNSASLYLLSFKGLAQEAGYFFMSWQMYNSLLSIINAIGIVFFSHGARSKDPRQALSEVARLTSLLLWLVLLTGLVGALLTPWMVPLILGSQYEPVVVYIAILLCFMPIASLTRILYPTLGGIGLPYLSMFLLIPALIVNVTLSWFLIDVIGIMGSFVALIVSQTVMVSGYLIVIKIKFGLSPWLFIIPQRKDLDKVVSKTLRTLKFARGEG
ncbi:hypothetical protein PSDVSF_23510 [Pseudodesulfovibrio sediminis]|uniref:Polysaccharide biosynthesis protein C-terminal domain-containing protein n=1 Tax=Pseudodesulfovibrio sediminis TaxID=2810563 RepID=A0ABM7P806_9BACT|nr:hypothetical protein PSDVSF_23510 [Pseudodesulfovibrio sediminis]